MKQKALISIFLFIMMVAAASLSAVSQDYINGYLAGYADGKSGIAAEYAQTENKDNYNNYIELISFQAIV